MSMTRLARRARRQLVRAATLHGPIGTARLVAAKMHTVLRGGRVEPEAVSDFDRRWNVDTDGNESLDDMELVDSTNALYGTRYQATSPALFDSVLAACPAISYEDYAFVDCGAGKGRILLLASALPFKEIVGVEFSLSLAAIARANVAAYDNPAQRCTRISVVCEDATRFRLPLSPIVVFLYNPFGEPVMRRFVKHLEASLETRPRHVIVLYRNPVAQRPWDESARFSRLALNDTFAIYESGSPGGASRE